MDYTAIFILACIFIPLERLIPLYSDQPVLRRDWLNDLFYVFFNSFLVRTCFVFIAGTMMLGYTMLAGPDPLPWVKEMPFVLQVIAVIIIADIGYYTAHRICHMVPVLWRFHAVHHSVEEMDWLATHRVHPVDQLFTNTLAFMPVYFIGFSLEALVVHQVIYQAHALLLHSNIRVNFGPLKWLIASPEYHHWHHANEKDAYDRNFASQLSVIDLIARTIFLPVQRQPVSYGLNEPMPRLYHQQFLHPFVKIAEMAGVQPNQGTQDMTNKLEDNLGKLAMLIVFGYLAVTQVFSLIATITKRDAIPLWELALISQLAGVLFLSLILYFTLTRLPPRESAAGIVPRLTAIAGTFIMMLLVVLPHESISPAMRVISTLIIITGTFLSIWCLRQLGKSFSIMATSRKLVTTGSYGIVRHPLYAAELVMIVGVVLSHGSLAAFGIGVLWLILQIRRAQFEESVLRQSFPEYDDYARRVPMLIPGLRLPFLDRPGNTVPTEASE